MAGIAGQPGTKPSAVQSPVPQTGDPFASGPEAAPAQGGVDPFSAGPGTEAAASSGSNSLIDPNSMTGKAVQGVASVLPVGMGIATSLTAGGPTNPAGIAMGMLGAAGGQGWKDLIEQQLLGKKPPADNGNLGLKSMTDAAGSFGADTVIGEAAFKGIAATGKFAMETAGGKAAAEWVAEQAKPAIDYVSNFTDSLKKTIVQPVTDYLEKNMAQGTAEQSGNEIKQKLGNLISGKFQQFKQSYAAINKVAADTPLADETRRGLTDKLRNDAVDLPQNLYGMVKRYANQIDGASNAQQVHEVISQVDGEIARLSSGKTSPAIRDQLAALEQFSNRATDFMENNTQGIAKRIASGKASPGEMQAFEQMMSNQANPTVPVGEQNLAKYAKSVANDYLDQRTQVNANYAKFRGLLEDVGEQTKTKAEGFGPMQFFRKVDEVPSEQLVERMFQPKNAAALRAMQNETPEVFQAVKQARVRDIYNNSMKDGAVDFKKLADNFDSLPESARSLIISDGERAEIRKIANSSSLKVLSTMQDNIATKFAKGVGDLAHFTAMAGGKGGKDLVSSPLGQAVANKTFGAGIRNAIPSPAQPPPAGTGQ